MQFTLNSIPFHDDILYKSIQYKPASAPRNSKVEYDSGPVKIKLYLKGE